MKRKSLMPFSPVDAACEAKEKLAAAWDYSTHSILSLENQS
jgi:hypothetical protein